jgi:hypothetical protein
MFVQVDENILWKWPFTILRTQTHRGAKTEPHLLTFSAFENAQNNKKKHNNWLVDTPFICQELNKDKPWRIMFFVVSSTLDSGTL